MNFYNCTALSSLSSFGTKLLAPPVMFLPPFCELNFSVKSERAKAGIHVENHRFMSLLGPKFIDNLFPPRTSNEKSIRDYLPLSDLPNGEDKLSLLSNEDMLQKWEPFLRKINNRKEFYGFDAWYLNLAHMAFTEIPDIDVFGSVRSLERLTQIDLSFNQFETLPEKVFAGLDNLQFLDLSHNKLKHVNHKWFKDLTLLQQLYLHENAIDPVTIDRGCSTFIYCKDLKVLTLYRQGEHHLCDTNLTGLPAVCKIWFTVHRKFQKHI